MQSSSSATDPRGPDPLSAGPLGFAHRGIHDSDIPENSMAAFKAAIGFGAGIECDVLISADDEPVVFHDTTLERLTGDRRKVSERTAGQLSAMRLLQTSQTIPRLSDVLALVGGRVPILLELKSGAGRLKLASAVAKQVRRYSGPVGVMSFDPEIVSQIRRIAPEIRRGLVVDEKTGEIGRRWRFATVRPDFVAVSRSLLGTRWASGVRKMVPLYCWTVRNSEDRAAVERFADAAIWEGDGRP